MGVVLTTDYIIIQLTHISTGYWILLTSLFVCQPNYNATQKRGQLRIFGTIIGIILATPILYFSPSIELQLLLIVVSGVCFFLFRAARYAYATAFITLLSFFCFNLLGKGVDVIIPRLIDTIIGCLVAGIAVNFIWPDWHFRSLAGAIRKISKTNGYYLSAIREQYYKGWNNHSDYRLARRNAHISDAEFASIISTLAVEPHSNKEENDLSFRLLMLNHTLLNYLSTLGAHRQKISSHAALLLLDDVTRYLKLLPISIPEDDYAKIRQQLETLLKEKTDNNNELFILQQILLIITLLPEYTQLTQQLIQVNEKGRTPALTIQ